MNLFFVHSCVQVVGAASRSTVRVVVANSISLYPLFLNECSEYKQLTVVLRSHCMGERTDYRLFHVLEEGSLHLPGRVRTALACTNMHCDVTFVHTVLHSLYFRYRQCNTTRTNPLGNT